MSKMGEEVSILVRFGDLGDSVTAINYGKTAGFGHIFIARSPLDYIFNRKSEPVGIVTKAAKKNAINMHYTGMRDLISFLLYENAKKNIRLRFYLQSSRGMGLQFAYYATATVLRVLFNQRSTQLKVDKYYVGTQYPQLLANNTIDIKNIERPNVALWVDSKQPSKDLNKDSVYKICAILNKNLAPELITIYGIKRLELELDFLPQNATNKTGRMSSKDFESSIELTDLAIVVDSGPMHLYALGRKPLIIFKGMRDGLVNWIPFSRKNVAVIFDDEIECRGCGRVRCKYAVNHCVNSQKNLKAFERVIERSTSDRL